MGYYTRFSMKCPEGAEEAAIVRKLGELNGLFSGPASLPCHSCGVTHEAPTVTSLSRLLEERLKWYEWENDLTELSVAFPSVTFVLKGEGQEQGDIWEAHATSGTITLHKAILIRPDDPLFESVANFIGETTT